MVDVRVYTVFSTFGLNYSRVCGQLQGYRFDTFVNLTIMTAALLLMMSMLKEHPSRMGVLPTNIYGNTLMELILDLSPCTHALCW